MAGKGGPRPGSGAPRGPRKATIERALQAEQIVANAERSGRKLAKDVLDEFMHLFAGMAAAYQPLPPGAVAPPNRTPDEARFDKYAKLAVDTAAALAKFQSPTFRAQLVMTPAAERPMPVGVDPAKIKTIDGKVVNLADQVAVARSYSRMVAGSKP